MDKKIASLKQMMEYFSCPGRPVTAPEFTKFWQSLSDDDKAFYKEGIGELVG